MINNKLATLNPFLEKRGFLFVFLLWLVIQVFCYFHFGVVTSCDTGFYEENAIRLINGNTLESRAYLYVSYISLLSILCAFNIPVVWIIIMQVLLGALALRCLYLLLLKVSNQMLTSVVGCLLYVLWFKFQQWNLIVYTDAVFTNLIIVCMYALSFYKNKIQLIGTILLIVFTTFIRPTGIGFLVAILTYFLYDNQRLKKYSLLSKTSCLVLIFAVILMILNHFLRGFVPDVIKGYSIVEIIYPKITLGVSRPENLYFPDSSQQPILQLFLFVIYNLGYMFKLFFIKAGLFLGHIKPYYSWGHNLFIGSFLFPMYYFAVRGVSKIPSSKILVFILVFIGFQFLTVVFTTENWDGRFLLPLLPWFFTLSAFGITKSLKYCI